MFGFTSTSTTIFFGRNGGGEYLLCAPFLNPLGSSMSSDSTPDLTDGDLITFSSSVELSSLVGSADAAATLRASADSSVCILVVFCEEFRFLWAT